MTHASRPLALVCTAFAVVLLFACGRRDNSQPPRSDAQIADSAGTDGAAADTGPVDPRCAPSPYTGHSCSADDTGISCAGNVSCACGFAVEDFMSFPTPCECRSGDLGQVYYCEDECESLCASVRDGGVSDAGTSDTGGSDAGPMSPCTTYCRLAEAEGCPLDDCVSMCEGQLTMACGAEFEAFVRCAPTVPVNCTDGTLFPDGCEPEVNALLACVSS